MTDEVDPSRRPDGRFAKGHSGNPKGARRRQPRPSGSAFDIIIDRDVPVMQDGKPRHLSVEEALQLRTYQDAIAGDRAALRSVLKMIEKREKWLAARAPKRPEVTDLSEVDPGNANEAMLLLGIVETDPRDHDPKDPYERLKLSPWAVQGALSRRGRKSISAGDVAEIKRCTRDPDTLRWPASIKR